MSALETRMKKLERMQGAALRPITAERFFAEVSKMTSYDEDSIDALSRCMSDVELQRAIDELTRLIAEDQK